MAHKGKRGPRLKAGEKPSPLPVPEVVKERIERQPYTPALYTDELGAKICELHAAGMTLNRICKMDGMPTRMTLWRWRNKKIPGVPAQFADDLEAARKIYLQHLEDEIIDIADDGRNDTYVRKNGAEAINFDVIARSRLRCDVRIQILNAARPENWKNAGDKRSSDATGYGPDRPLGDLSDQALIDELQKRKQERPVTNGAGTDAGRAPRGNGEAMH
jgi:hypothetical protein